MSTAQSFTLPNTQVFCKEVDPAKITLAIKYLRLLGVPVYNNTREYDSEYPYIMFDRILMTQTNENWINNNDCKSVNTVEEFVALFEGHKSIKIEHVTSSNYTAEIDSNGIKVGCQDVIIPAFLEVIKAAMTYKLITLEDITADHQYE